MPTYDYACTSCGKTFEIFHGFHGGPPEDWACCESPQLRKLISPGSGVIFKGSGFYETDYKRSKPTESTTESKSDGKSESKSESSGDSKKSSETKSSDSGKSGGSEGCGKGTCGRAA